MKRVRIWFGMNIKFSQVQYLFDQSMESAKENLLQQQDSEVESIHLFSLKPLHNLHSSVQAVAIDFTPRFSESQQVSITPKINFSKDCFEPLFQNPYINNKLLANPQISEALLSFKQKPKGSPFSQRSSQGKNEGSKPKPTSKFCQLCKSKFDEDYLDHINHIVHVNNLKANPYQKYIQTLIQDFKRKAASPITIQSNERDEITSGKQKKKIKTDCLGSKSDNLNIVFPYKTASSTESTHHCSAIEEKLKTQTLNSLKE